MSKESTILETSPRVWLWPLVALALQSACSSVPATNTTQARPANNVKEVEATLPKTEENPPRPLPAGLYFRDGHYEHRACPGCEEPRWAVITGVYDAIEDANSAISPVYTRAPMLPAGYPWATHTQDLAIDDPSKQGVVVVTGLFAKESDAKQWSSAHGGDWSVVRLATHEVALERLYERLGDINHVEEDEHVFQLEHDARRQPVKAYAPADLEKLSKELDSKSWNSFEEYKAMREEMTNALEPACELPSGKLFLTRGYDDFNRFQRAFLPTSCDDGQLAYVPLQHTRHQAVIAPTKDGNHRIVQVIIVECDVAFFQEWRYSIEAGRRPPREDETTLALESSGCGEP